MVAIKGREELPSRFEDLARQAPPRAIMTEAEHERTLDLIDQFMARRDLTRGQRLYMATLVQLVQGYESDHWPIDVSDISGLSLLRHVLAENQLVASDLARLLGVHASLGSKILRGDRTLTVAHARVLARRFKLRFERLLSERPTKRRGAGRPVVK